MKVMKEGLVPLAESTKQSPSTQIPGNSQDHQPINHRRDLSPALRPVRNEFQPDKTQKFNTAKNNRIC